MNVWYRAGLRGYAQALTSKQEIATVRSWPTNKLRDLAQGQIKLAKDAFAKASGVAWYEGLYVRYSNHVRWGPTSKQIDDAEESFKAGDDSQVEAEKREHYIAAWTVARLAVSEIAKEAQFGETSFIYLAEETGRAIATAAKPYVDNALNAGEDVLTAIKWIGGIGLLIFILRETRR